jgi:hypothetical protein
VVPVAVPHSCGRKPSLAAAAEERRAGGARGRKGAAQSRVLGEREREFASGAGANGAAAVAWLPRSGLHQLMLGPFCVLGLEFPKEALGSKFEKQARSQQTWSPVIFLMSRSRCSDFLKKTKTSALC